MARFNDEITALQWDEIVFNADGDLHVVDLPDVASDTARLRELNRLVGKTQSFAEFIAAVRSDSQP